TSRTATATPTTDAARRAGLWKRRRRASGTGIAALLYRGRPRRPRSSRARSPGRVAPCYTALTVNDATRWLLVGYGCLWVGVYAANGALHPVSFPLVLGAVLCAIGAAWRPTREPNTPAEARLRKIALVALVVFVVLSILRPPGEYLRPPGLPVWHVVLQLAMAGLLATVLFARTRRL